jgi:hypothetical protein
MVAAAEDAGSGRPRTMAEAGRGGGKGREEADPALPLHVREWVKRRRERWGKKEREVEVAAGETFACKKQRRCPCSPSCAQGVCRVHRMKLLHSPDEKYI